MPAVQTETPSQNFTDKMTSLSISKSSSKSKKKDSPIADSWEDAAASDSGSDTETETHEAPHNTAPPPTPSSPNFFGAGQSHGGVGGGMLDFTNINGHLSSIPNTREMGDKRPEKSTAAASRLIAAGIGARVPKMSQEQREYERAVREKERKRRDAARNEEKVREERDRREREAVWDD